MKSEPSLRPGARVLRAGDTPADLPAGTANVIRLRPGGRVEILLDVEVCPKHDERLRVMRAVDLIPVKPDLSHLTAQQRADQDLVRNHGAWYDLPYAGVPWNTSRGLAHKVVAIYGTLFTGWGSSSVRVVGVTACGKGRSGNLELDRGASSFPQCKRCWRD